MSNAARRNLVWDALHGHIAPHGVADLLGMREFGIRTIAGHRMMFGQPTP